MTMANIYVRIPTIITFSTKPLLMKWDLIATCTDIGYSGFMNYPFGLNWTTVFVFTPAMINIAWEY